MSSISFRDVRRTYDKEKRWSELTGDLAAFLIYRPLSFWVTPLFARLAIPAMGVTHLALVCALALPFVALLPHGFIWTAALAFVFNILDCVDGNLARLRQQVSSRGAYFDMLGGQVFIASQILAMGVLVAVNADGWQAVLAPWVGALTATVALLSRVCRDFVAQKKNVVSGTTAASGRSLRRSDLFVSVFGGLEHLYCFAILVGGLANRLDGVLAFATVYTLIVFIVVQVQCLRAL